MKNILEIFIEDVKNICKSKMAIIIIIGIIFIPGIYAWLNIDSNWGPYDNTGNIPIAIVNNDKGIKLFGDEINIGDEIEKDLKKNDAMKWTFTSKKKAVKNVNNGNYYGAIIIPEDFSRRLSSLTDDNRIKKPTFDFYINNKKNAIAPIIVNKAVGTIQNSVNQSFVNKVLYKVFDKASDIDVISKTDASTQEIISKLENAKGDVKKLQAILTTTGYATDTTGKSLEALKELLPTVVDLSNSSKESVRDLKDAAKSFESSFNNIDNQVKLAVSDTENSLKETISLINKTDSSNIESNIKKINDKLSSTKSDLERLDSILITVSEVTGLDEVKKIEEQVSGHISDIDNIKNRLNNADDKLKEIKNLKNDINSKKESIVNIKNEYNDKLKNDINEIYKRTSESINSAMDTLSNLNGSMDNVDLSMKYMIDALKSGSKLTRSVNTVLDGFVGDIDKVIGVVREAEKSELYANIVKVLKNNPDDIADFLSSPVETNQIDVYPIETYGSKMAPFYSILACWVGATILLAILRINTNKNKKARYSKHYQKYFGRFMIFGILAMLQGLIIGLGDLFLQVQVINWFLFLITLMVSSLIFVLIIYSLTTAFGKIGQALSIVIMVLQVAGSGGTFPIELLPRGFKLLQPFMPFYPAMNAVRETIGGFYGNDYIKYIGILLLHIFIPLFLGLVFSKYASSIKEKISNTLDVTGIIE